jgi:hypothetical protein
MRATHLDQVGVPRISRDSKVVIALLLERVLVLWSCPRRNGVSGVPFSSNARRRGLASFATVSGDAIRMQITVYLRYFEERTNRPDMIDAEDRKRPKRITKN